MNGTPERKYKSPTKEWDVFLSHASEDKPYVRAVAAGLEKRGITYLLDEKDFVAGRSLRGQIDAGILNSYLGVLFISPNFIVKRWTREELDGFFILENDGGTKLLPVWLDVDVNVVSSFSPMLAARLAIPANEDPDETAASIARHLDDILYAEGGWGQRVRIDALNLPWHQRPAFLRESVKILDDYMPYFWVPWRSEKELPGGDGAVNLRIGQAVMSPILYDGVQVILVGHQKQVQVYSTDARGLREWVFQLRTVDPEYAQTIVYVRCAGPINNENEWPVAPKGELTIVVGYIIASGPMTAADGSLMNAVYLIAAKVMHHPPLD